MTAIHRRPGRLCLIAALAVIAIACGLGLAQIQPVGRNAAALIQFDVLSELNMDEAFTNWVVFARYWVCGDFYAVSVVWSEPHGAGMQNMKTLTALSDNTGFRMTDERYADWVPLNTTYSKPLGERGPFAWGGAAYELADMRFAEADALSRRLYVRDLMTLKDANPQGDKIIDLKAMQGPDGVKRKVTRLKVQAKRGQIEGMDLFDDQQQSLCKIEYEYERNTTAPPLARLIAELPVRPQKLAIRARLKCTTSDGEIKPFEVKDADYVYHKGGRTCTVTYQDIAIGDKTLRLPVLVEVRVSETKRLLRSAKLINFKPVDLDKDAVWEAARSFAHQSSEDQAWRRLVGKYLDPKPKPGPLQVDPNDLTFVRKLIAKYPLRELPPMADNPRSKTGTLREQIDNGAWRQDPTLLEEWAKNRTRESEEEQKKWREQAARIPSPPRIEIEPNDARAIRQLDRYYTKKLSGINGPVPESKQEMFDLRERLRGICSYHRVPHLPEDDPPEVDSNDLQMIQQLKTHYEKLATQSDRGLGGQFQAVHVLTRLDRIARDFDAFEKHTHRYLQMLQEAGLDAMYMVGGHGNLETLVVAGRHEEANRLLRRWADRSAAENDADAVLRFAGWDVDGSKRDPWASIQLLDRFLKRSGLSPLQRYEGLALRAIALHNLDKLLGSLATVDSDLRRAQGQWVLSTTTRGQVVRRVRPAVLEAVSAWESLGGARWSEAKPYSTAQTSGFMLNLMGNTEATRLQETSAMLDSIVRKRLGGTGNRQRGAGP